MCDSVCTAVNFIMCEHAEINEIEITVAINSLEVCRTGVLD